MNFSAAVSSPCVLAGVTPDQKDVVVQVAAKMATLFDVALVCAHVDPDRYTVRKRPDGTVESRSIDPDLPDDGSALFDPGLRSRIADLVPSSMNFVGRELAGEPARALSEQADALNAEAIVVGSRSGGWRASVQDFLGTSVAVHLVHRQWRPVIVVPISPTAPGHPLPWESSSDQSEL